MRSSRSLWLIRSTQTVSNIVCVEPPDQAKTPYEEATLRTAGGGGESPRGGSRRLLSGWPDHVPGGAGGRDLGAGGMAAMAPAGIYRA